MRIGETFSMGTHWDDQGRLVSTYKLGNADVSEPHGSDPCRELADHDRDDSGNPV